MSEQPANWIELADAGREAWEALGPCEREELLAEWPCAACPNCSEPRGHQTPHSCDCQARWEQ